MNNKITQTIIESCGKRMDELANIYKKDKDFESKSYPDLDSIFDISYFAFNLQKFERERFKCPFCKKELSIMFHKENTFHKKYSTNNLFISDDSVFLICSCKSSQEIYWDMKGQWERRNKDNVNSLKKEATIDEMAEQLVLSRKFKYKFSTTVPSSILDALSKKHKTNDVKIKNKNFSLTKKDRKIFFTILHLYKNIFPKEYKELQTLFQGSVLNNMKKIPQSLILAIKYNKPFKNELRVKSKDFYLTVMPDETINDITKMFDEMHLHWKINY